MMRHSVFVACAAAALLMSLSACTGAGEEPGAAPSTSTAPSTPTMSGPALEDWAQKAFDEEIWGSPGAFKAAGGIGPGQDGGLEFTPAKAGWYRIGMVCEGASSIDLKVSSADGPLGAGSADCGPAVNTRMKLPAGMVNVTVDGTGAEGQWAVAVAPTEAP
ncbi:hypothetical protein LVY72_14630 [Arthrobacter sp. I2-34]|uniref:Lipoprotein n=1 Tax=Arthrobacter hankyongi TaxID=2904801 RepID=A0ABS9L913_9MICC|nr:hypothetical protein [Arthrobacter hankyongi]MCG2623135.1 hypothetical protein [Arthrobacter hankyongi]